MIYMRRTVEKDFCRLNFVIARCILRLNTLIGTGTTGKYYSKSVNPKNNGNDNNYNDYNDDHNNNDNDHDNDKSSSNNNKIFRSTEKKRSYDITENRSTR